MSEISISTTGIDSLVRGFSNGDDIIADEMTKTITRAVIRVESSAKKIVFAEAKDTGNLARGMAHKVTTSGATVEGEVGNKVPYAPAIHDGRDPGKMPPPGALLDWMRRHGIDASDETVGRSDLSGYQPKGGGYFPVEFVIARAINAKKGREVKFLTRGLAENKGAILADFDKLGGRVAKRIKAGA